MFLRQSSKSFQSSDPTTSNEKSIRLQEKETTVSVFSALSVRVGALLTISVRIDGEVHVNKEKDLPFFRVWDGFSTCKALHTRVLDLILIQDDVTPRVLENYLKYLHFTGACT